MQCNVSCTSIASARFIHTVHVHPLDLCILLFNHSLIYAPNQYFILSINHISWSSSSCLIIEESFFVVAISDLYKKKPYRFRLYFLHYFSKLLILVFFLKKKITNLISMLFCTLIFGKKCTLIWFWFLFWIVYYLLIICIYILCFMSLVKCNEDNGRWHTCLHL